MRERWILPFVLLALAAMLGSCIPVPWINPWTGRVRGFEVPASIMDRMAGERYTVCIDGDCKATLEGGGSVDPLKVDPGDYVCWKNCSETNTVHLRFEKDELFGRTSLRLAPGEQVCLRVRPGAAGKSYEYGWLCCDIETGQCKTGGVGGPKVDVGEGGP